MSLQSIAERIRAAEGRAGRTPGSVTLIAVSKVQPAERVEAVLEQGHRIFGENRVQEAQTRWPEFQARYAGISLHLIGPLQSNKARAAMGMVDAIHSVDRVKLAETLARLADEIGRCPELFVQVNTGAEPQKAGLLPEAVDGFVAACRGAWDLPVAGLMCIPPVDAEPDRHFALLADLAARNGLGLLSMGMSDDFERAIARPAVRRSVAAPRPSTRHHCCCRQTSVSAGAPVPHILPHIHYCRPLRYQNPGALPWRLFHYRT